MAEEFKGLSQEQLDKLDQFQEGTAQIYESYKALNAELKNIDTAQDKLNKTQFVGRDITTKIATLQKEAVSRTDSVRKLEAEKTKQLALAAKLEARRVTLMGKAATVAEDVRKVYLKQAENLANAAENAKAVAKAIGETQEDAAKLDKSSKFFTTASKFFGDLPGIRKLSVPFDAAAKASKETVLNNAKLKKGAAGMKSPFGQGFNALTKSISKSLISITAVTTAIKFVVDLFIAANKQTVELARSMGSSVDQADQLRGQFADIRRDTGLTRNNTVQLVKAQASLNEQFGATFRASDDILDNFTYLTSRVKLSTEEASKLSIRMSATQENANLTSDNILGISNNFKAANGFGMSFKGIMKAVAGATGQIAASFGFSNEAIAKGVLQVRRFGVNLQQASNVANNLLDFEQSIGAELEAELLTGQQFNLERARAKAATGDIAGATADVLSQMQNLTEEQRKSPVIMEAIAKATGLSADELQKAYLIQGNNTVAAEEYYRLLKEGTKDEINAFLIRSNLSEQARKDIEKRKTAEENFTEAMDDLKSTFVDFVDGGFLTELSESIKTFAQFVNNSFGESSDRSKAVGERAMNISDKQLEAAGVSVNDFNEIAKIASKKKGKFGVSDMSTWNFEVDDARKELRRIENTEITPDDFTIRQNPKDTLVMAGGTQFGKETNGLLRQLISAVEGGKVINLEGRRVGETLVMSSYKS
jgi:hypothetical protein